MHKGFHKGNDNKLTIRIDGPHFPIDKFVKAIQNFDSILREIDKETSEDGKQTVTWSIQSLKEGSLIVTAQGNPCKEDVQFERTAEIVDCFADGFESLRRNTERPNGFSHAAMRYAKSFAELLDPNDFAEVNFLSKGWKFSKMDEVAINLLQEPKKSYSFWGSIQGKMVSLNNERKTRFGIRSKGQSRIINCFLEGESLFKIALQAIEEKSTVYVYGEIRQIWNGRKVNIKASEIKILPSVNKVKSSDEILKRMRALKEPDK